MVESPFDGFEVNIQKRTTKSDALMISEETSALIDLLLLRTEN